MGGDGGGVTTPVEQFEGPPEQFAGEAGGGPSG